MRSVRRQTCAIWPGFITAATLVLDGDAHVHDLSLTRGLHGAILVIGAALVVRSRAVALSWQMFTAANDSVDWSDVGFLAVIACWWHPFRGSRLRGLDGATIVVTGVVLDRAVACGWSVLAEVLPPPQTWQRFG